MKPPTVAAMTIALGTAAALLLGWVVHFLWPVGGWIVFATVETAWVWTGWRIVNQPPLADA